MKPVTRPFDPSPRGVEPLDLAAFSRNVSADLDRLAAEAQATENRQAENFSRLLRETQHLARTVDGLRRGLDLLSAQGASRQELEELASAGSITAPDDRATAYAFLPSLDTHQLQLVGAQVLTTSEGGYGGVSLPTINRTPLLFGNDPVSGQVVFPKDLSATFQSLDEGDPLMIRQTDPLMALNDDERQPYSRSVYYASSSTRASVRGAYRIRIPSSLRGSLQLNMIELSPYPMFSTTILSVKIYSYSGSLMQTIQGPWSGPVQLPLSSSGASTVGEIVVELMSNDGVYREGRLVYSYGLAQVGLFQTRYADTGAFTVYFNSANSRPVQSFVGLSHNLTAGVQTLIPTGLLTLSLEVPLAGTIDRLDDSRWRSVFNSANYLSGFGQTGRSADFFPTAGVASGSDAPIFLVRGTLRSGSPRPLVADLQVAYTQ